MSDLVLEARDVRVAFGGIVACDRVDLGLARGEVVGLTGPNGSGKSTFLNAVSGLVPATGELTIAGERVALGHPRDVRRRGVVRAFQSPQNWGELSSLDNVALGCSDRRATGLAAAVLRRPTMRRHERDRWRLARRALERVGLAGLAATPAAGLTYGQKRLLELARAIAAEGTVLLLDEPAAGLNEAETRFLAELLTELRDEGLSLVVIDHKIDFLDRICDRITVLQLGRVIAAGSPEEIWREQSVVDAYLGVEEADS